MNHPSLNDPQFPSDSMPEKKDTHTPTPIDDFFKSLIIHSIARLSPLQSPFQLQDRNTETLLKQITELTHHQNTNTDSTRTETTEKITRILSTLTTNQNENPHPSLPHTCEELSQSLNTPELPTLIEKEILTLTAHAFTACTLPPTLQEKYITAFETLFHKLKPENPKENHLMRYLCLLIGLMKNIPIDTIRKGIPLEYLETFDLMTDISKKMHTHTKTAPGYPEPKNPQT